MDIEFKDIESMMSFIEKLEEEGPYPDAEKDLELSEKSDYEVMSRIRGRGALNFEVPDLTRPLSLMKVESGMVVVEGFGRSHIPFRRSFSGTPGIQVSKFGFFELRVPWIVLEWRAFRIAWWYIRLPVPKLRTMTIRLPTMCFLMNVNKSGFEVFNVFGRTYLTYTAIGR